MEIIIPVQVEELENDEYLITSEELPDLIAQGRTIAETLEIASDVARKLYESYVERNVELPPIFKKLKSRSSASLAVNIPQ